MGYGEVFERYYTINSDNERGMHWVSLTLAFDKQPRDVTSMDASEEDARARKLTGFKRSPNIIRIDVQTRSGCFFCIPIRTVEGIWRVILALRTRTVCGFGSRSSESDRMKEERSSLDMNWQAWCDQGVYSMVQVTWARSRQIKHS